MKQRIKLLILALFITSLTVVSGNHQNDYTPLTRYSFVEIYLCNE